jgi:hypothetical protein
MGLTLVEDNHVAEFALKGYNLAKIDILAAKGGKTEL